MGAEGDSSESSWADLLVWSQEVAEGCVGGVGVCVSVCRGQGAVPKFSLFLVFQTLPGGCSRSLDTPHLNLTPSTPHSAPLEMRSCPFEPCPNQPLSMWVPVGGGHVVHVSSCLHHWPGLLRQGAALGASGSVWGCWHPKVPRGEDNAPYQPRFSGISYSALPGTAVLDTASREVVTAASDQESTAGHCIR